VQVAIDAADLGGCLAHPGGDPTQHHLPVLPALDVGGMIAADLDHRLDGVGATQSPSQGGRHAEAADGEGLSQPFPQGRGGAGVGAVQLPGQGLQLGLGDQRVGVAVGGPHPLGHGGGDGVGEPVGHIPQLVQLAALNDWVIEHVGDGAAQRLGAVEHDQQRPGHIESAVAQAGQQVTHHGGVLGGALGQGEGDLGAVQGDPEGDHAGVLGHLDAVDQQRHQVQAGQVGGQQLG
jgi:hypothetical protein